MDRLACTELRAHALPTGVVSRLYRLARREKPLSLMVAEALTGPDVRSIGLFTGIVHEKQPKGELDGPIGCAVLATSLERTGRKPAVFAPSVTHPVIAAAREALRGGFAIEPDERAPQAASTIDAAVSIERLGRNRKGVYHSIFGIPRSQHGLVDDLFDSLNRAGRLTIAIGDGGNEIGFGKVFGRARAIVPRGRECGCPCGDGIVAHTAARHLLVASVSNFGAYAVASAMAGIAGELELAPQPEDIVKAMHAAIDAGGIDGGSMIAGRVADDGITDDTVAALVKLMRAAIEMSLSPA